MMSEIGTFIKVLFIVFIWDTVVRFFQRPVEKDIEEIQREAEESKIRREEPRK
ncbi:MAG: hypothetical protein L0Y56_06235 [Nitrospira sp.]|nr:hypothetical protein [Nitrospira sp.]